MCVCVCVHGIQVRACIRSAHVCVYVCVAFGGYVGLYVCIRGYWCVYVCVGGGLCIYTSIYMLTLEFSQTQYLAT